MWRKVINIIKLKKNKVKLVSVEYESTARFACCAEVKFSKIGAYSSIGRYAKITHTDIGKFCAISWDVTINAIQHDINKLTIHSFPKRPDLGFNIDKDFRKYEKVIIKNDVWVGANSVIMPGITIGNGAIIGAGAVVTKDVPDYAIVAGVPAKIIKWRFPKKFINELLEIEWWNFDYETIKENIHLWQQELNEDILQELKKLKKYANK